MCTSALRALKSRYPSGSLTVVAKPALCELLQGLPFIDHFIELPVPLSAMALWRVAREIRRTSPDVAFVFPHSFRAALLAYWCGASHRIGIDRGGRNFLLTRVVDKFDSPVYTGAEYSELLAEVDIWEDMRGLELALAPGVADAIAGTLDPNRPAVAIAPGAAFGPSKLWPASRFAAVANSLCETYSAQCILITGPGEEALRERVLADAPHAFVEVKNSIQPMEWLKAVIARADLLICNDSGPRHIAVAFKTPVICLMGPTSPRYTETAKEIGKVLRTAVPCSPCQLKICPIDHRCMNDLPVEWVTREAAKYMIKASAKT